MAAFLRWYYPIQVPGYSSQPDIYQAPRAKFYFKEFTLLSGKDEQLVEKTQQNV